MRKVTKLLMLLMISVFLEGCDTGGKSAKIPDLELRKKWKECNMIEKPSRIKALACENYTRQCAKRKKAGNLVCY